MATTDEHPGLLRRGIPRFARDPARLVAFWTHQNQYTFTATPTLGLGVQGLGGGAGGGGERVGDLGECLVVVGGGDEPGLEGGRGKVHAAVEHGVEKRGVRGGGL